MTDYTEINVPVPADIAHYAPDLRWFFETMVRKLYTNRHKGFGEYDEPKKLLDRLEGELLEMDQALAAEGQFDFTLEAVDVANFALLCALSATRMDKKRWGEVQQSIADTMEAKRDIKRAT